MSVLPPVKVTGEHRSSARLTGNMSTGMSIGSSGLSFVTAYV